MELVILVAAVLIIGPTAHTANARIADGYRLGAWDDR
jgi:hypothetical protein